MLHWIFFSYPVGRLSATLRSLNDIIGRVFSSRKTRDRLGALTMRNNTSTKRAQESSTRAKRFHVQIPVRYRVADSPEWIEARTENVSYTGVLFRTKSILKPTTVLDVRLELPSMNGDGDHSEVVCKCQVVRVDKTRSTKNPPALAVAIQDYRLTRTPQPN